MAAFRLAARRVEQILLPVVDVGALFSGDGAARRAVAAELRQACLDKGFFYICNHGIPSALIDEVFRETKLLFDLPMPDKLALNSAHSVCTHGYEPLRGQTLEPGSAADLKEGFYIGCETPPASPAAAAYPFSHGPNQWPATLSSFRPVMTSYYAAMVDLSERLMRALALSLDLDDGFFDGFCREPLARLRLLHYPPQPSPAAAEEKGAGAHTDFGGITLLLQDDRGGLQVYDHASEDWIHADPVPGTYVVNLGDLIARWTNDRYHSTLHRVVNLSGEERYSVPFFFNGNLAHTVACIPTCLTAGEAPQYPVTTVGEHFREKFSRSYKA